MIGPIICANSLNCIHDNNHNIALDNKGHSLIAQKHFPIIPRPSIELTHSNCILALVE